MKDESKNLEFRSQDPGARREEEEPRIEWMTRIFLATEGTENTEKIGIIFYSISGLSGAFQRGRIISIE
jgi:hypothetical protein